MGGNAALHRAYGCPIAVPAGEAPLIDAWDERALLLDYADQRAERFAVDEVLQPGATHVVGRSRMARARGARPRHGRARVLQRRAPHPDLGRRAVGERLRLRDAAGDRPAALPATRATLEMIAGLDARCVIPGHGEPFADVGAALERAFRRTAAFEADPLRMARHALKVAARLFAARPGADAARGAARRTSTRVGIYRDFNARFFRLPPAALAESSSSELERAGAVRRDDG